MPHRAVFWPGGGSAGSAARVPTLILADLHLGKIETYLVNGLGLPGAVTAEQLDRLGEALDVTGAQRVLVVGDLLHAPAGLTEPLIDTVARWRALRSVEFCVVPGNHDRKLDRLVDAWKLTALPERYDEGPFSFCHVPEIVAGKFTWSGHEHPAVRIGRGLGAAKLPAFHIEDAIGVLPAFSRFTGGGVVSGTPARGRGRARLFGIADGEVLDCTPIAVAQFAT